MKERFVVMIEYVCRAGLAGSGASQAQMYSRLICRTPIELGAIKSQFPVGRSPNPKGVGVSQ